MESTNPTNGSSKGDIATLRQFLLGMLGDEVVAERLERELLANEQFGELLGVVEGSLIEDYLDGRLSMDETRQFEMVFLGTAERRQQVRLISRLRQISLDSGSDAVDKQPLYRSRPWKTPIFRLGILSLVLIALGLSVWRWALNPAENNEGIAALRQAYGDQRPVRSRIAAFSDYRPYNETRGSATRVYDQAARDRAERLLLSGTKDSNSYKAHRDLATLYLVDKKYDLALAEFNAAHTLAPRDPSVEADLGATYMEMARENDDAGTSLRLIDNSLEHLNAALNLDPQLPEALYNKAMCLQLAFSVDQAKEAWATYLSVDPESKWANEARDNLQQLEKTTPSQDRSAKDLENEFLDATRSGDRSTAGSLLAENHELFREKFLPVRIAASYTDSKDDRHVELLKALRFAAELERERSGDELANAIATFYVNARPSSLGPLKAAHAALTSGVSACLASDYPSAKFHFDEAFYAFSGAKDKPEAEIAHYLMAYTLANTGRSQEALREFKALRTLAKDHHYLWLEAISTYWAAGSHEKLGEHTLARDLFRESLRLSEKNSDRYTAERNLLDLALLSSETGQQADSLKYLAKVLKDSSEHPTSIRQTYRDLSTGFEILVDLGLPHIAEVVALASVTTADDTQDPTWMTESRDQAAYAVALTGKVQNTGSFLRGAEDKIQLIEGEGTRARLDAFTDLTRGEVASLRDDLEEADRSYTSAVSYYDRSDHPYFRKRAHLGLLKALKAENRIDRLEVQIPKSIEMIEGTRSEILDERERAGFLDTNENVYDIATDFEYGRANYNKALSYAESSSSRSLLDWLKKGGSSNDSRRPSFASGEIAQPLAIDELRSELPADTQIIKYAVLEDKLLIWVISRDQVSAASVPISRAALQAKLDTYEQQIALNVGSASEERGRLGAELYGILIAPINQNLKLEKRTCIVPSKELFHFPFAALPVPDGSWLIAKYALIYAPSLNVFLHCTKAAQAKSGRVDETLLAVGNPAFDKTAFPGTPYLSNASEEVAEIATAYTRHHVVSGSEATKQRFLSDLKQADVVHFAGHYVVSDGAPGSSFMLLAKAGTDGAASKLTNDELLSEHLSRTRLIVLAACRSGMESSSESEGLIGLSRTFLAAGVPLVIGTQWDVDSEATARLMQHFHTSRREEHLPTVEALRSAQIDLANDPSGRFKDPYYWAGFVTIGGAADF